MTPDQYHRMLLGIDSVIEVFKEAKGNLTPEDTELKFQLALMRAHVLRAESGHPFPSQPPSKASDSLSKTDEITQAPWQR